MTSNNLPQVVKFNNQDVPVFFHENKPYVAMKPICENIGLDWEAQRQRIKRNHALSQGACMIKAPSKGGEQEVLTLPIGYLNGWLFGIDVNRVKPEIKDTLIKYQLECYDVLYKHFMPKVAELHPNTITVEQQQQIKDAVLAKVHRDKKHYQTVYTEFYREFNIPRYQELPLDRFNDAMSWLGDGFYTIKSNLNDELYREIYDICLDALATNQDHIQLLHNMNITFRSDTIINMINFTRQENTAIFHFARKHNLLSKHGNSLISDSGYVEFYNGGGFSMRRGYFV